MSARDRFKNLNQGRMGLDNESGDKTIVDDVQESYENSPVTPQIEPEVTKNRRRKFADDAVTKFLNVQLLESEIKFLEKYGGEFGGKTGYVRKLVQEEMKRVNKQ